MLNLSRFKSIWSDNVETHAERTEEPSEARFRAWALALLILVGPAFLFFLYYKLRFFGLANSDALDFAQIGRNLANGKGFVTSVIRPLAITGPVTGNVQETIHGPVYPILLALAFNLRGASDYTAAQVSGLLYILTVPMVYVLGSRIFNRKVGLLAAGAFAVNAMMLEYAISGMHITLCVFLATWMLIVLHSLLVKGDATGDGSAAPMPRGRLIQLGILASLLYLTEPVFVWLVPVIVASVVFYGGQYRWKNMLWALIPVLVLVVPWMVRNTIIAQDPVYGLRGNEFWMHTPGFYTKDAGYRLDPSEVAGSAPLLKAIVRKFFVGMGKIVQTVPQFSGSWLLAFFLPALFVNFQAQSSNHVRKTVLWCAGFLTLGMVLLGAESLMPLYLILVPAILTYSLCYAAHLLQQANPERVVRQSAAMIMLAIVCYPLLVNLISEQDNPRPLGYRVATILAKSTGQNDACLTDQPCTVAWYGNLRAVWLPGTINTTKKVREQVAGLRWLILTANTRGYSQDWRKVYQGMYYWSVQAMNAKRANPGQTVQPLPLKVDKAGAEKYPLVPVLDGFVAEPPLDEKEPSTVVARVSSNSQKVGMSPAG